MTVAVCFKCGEIKFGAWVPCKNCGAEPRTEDDYAVSVVMSDHYQLPENLKQLRDDIAQGKRPVLPPELRRRVIQGIRPRLNLPLEQKAQDVEDM